MTARGRRTGPVPKGICPVCHELRHLRLGGVMGQHRAIYRRHYRGATCAGVDQPAAIHGPEPDPQTEQPPNPPRSPAVEPTAKINLGANGATVVLNDVDVARHITHLTLETDGRETTATVQLLAGRAFELEADAAITLDDTTRAALLALGWTPPAVEDDTWRCTRCKGTQWIGWRAGPAHEGFPRKAQCVPCGHVQDLPKEALDHPGRPA